MKRAIASYNNESTNGRQFPSHGIYAQTVCEILRKIETSVRSFVDFASIKRAPFRTLYNALNINAFDILPLARALFDTRDDNRATGNIIMQQVRRVVSSVRLTYIMYVQLLLFSRANRLTSAPESWVMPGTDGFNSIVTRYRVRW